MCYYLNVHFQGQSFNLLDIVLIAVNAIYVGVCLKKNFFRTSGLCYVNVTLCWSCLFWCYRYVFCRVLFVKLQFVFVVSVFITIIYREMCGDCAKHIDIRRDTLMLHIGMWVFRSAYSDIVTLYCTADVECHFVTELHL